MTVRDYEQTDEAAVEKFLQDSGMDYRMPDLEDPLFIVRKVLVGPNGQIAGAAFLKIQAEEYLMLDCGLDIREKTRTIAHLSHAVEREAYNRGLDTLVAYIPEDICKKFAKRLTLLGWSEARRGWRTWFRELL